MSTNKSSYDNTKNLFLKDQYEKEIRQNVKFAVKYKDRIQAAYDSIVDKVPKDIDDAPKNEMRALMISLTQNNINRGDNVMQKPEIVMPRLKDLRHGHSILEQGLGNLKDDPRLAHSDELGDPVMRPVDEKTREILFDPYLPLVARKKYLKKRAHVRPEERYYFPETVNMDYGWRLMDACDPPYKHLIRFVKKEALCRVGPQPDPPHYVEPVK